MSVPLVSVIIPTHNCGAFLHRALDTAFGQEDVSVEVIVVDSSNDDSCKNICQRYGPSIQYLFQEPRGVSAARNLGIQRARGSFVAFLDADDEWLPKKLAEQVAAFDRFPDAALVFTDTLMFEDGSARTSLMSKSKLEDWCRTHGSEIAGWYYGDLYPELLKSDCMNTSSVMVRSEILRRVGTFDEQFRVGEDYDLWLRIAPLYPMVYLDRTYCKYRVRPDGLSGGDDVRALRWLESHLAVREKHRLSGSVPSEHLNLLRDVLSDRYWELGNGHFGSNRLAEARKCFWKALRARPLRPKRWLYLASAFLPVSGIQSIRRLKQGVQKPMTAKT